MPTHAHTHRHSLPHTLEPQPKHSRPLRSRAPTRKTRGRQAGRAQHQAGNRAPQSTRTQHRAPRPCPRSRTRSLSESKRGPPTLRVPHSPDPTHTSPLPPAHTSPLALLNQVLGGRLEHVEHRNKVVHRVRDDGNHHVPAREQERGAQDERGPHRQRKVGGGQPVGHPKDEACEEHPQLHPHNAGKVWLEHASEEQLLPDASSRAESRNLQYAALRKDLARKQIRELLDVPKRLDPDQPHDHHPKNERHRRHQPLHQRQPRPGELRPNPPELEDTIQNESNHPKSNLKRRPPVEERPRIVL
mmetsp:Transcript_50475/g.123095  ORF Transcript_50475/g.123095 Transcript_50475/m.123095 type:complete len:301 (+) Transcript_50475:203-1105(+)